MNAVPTVAPGEQPPAGPGDASVACLDPSAPFPEDVAQLGLLELHVWHSRICRRLEEDFLAPEGPHPLTLDRHRELVDELDARSSAPGEPGPAS